MRAPFRVLSSFIIAALAACSTNPGGNGDGGTAPAAGTVAAIVAAGAKSPTAAKVNTAVVVATSSYTDSGVQVGTFYVQDPSPHSTVGLSVYVSKSDSVTFPNIGDTVSVQGSVSIYDGSLQMSSASGTPLVITAISTGTSSGGAYPPAGSPIKTAATGQYDHTNTGAHAEQIGNVLQFTGALVVLDAGPDFVETKSGGTTEQEGFAVSGGMWVWDTNIYDNCMKLADGGTLYPSLDQGITGVWDHYQDQGNPSATDYPVLIPQTCADVGLTDITGTTPNDGGTTPNDGGTTTTPDAGTISYTVMTVQDAFTTARTTGTTASVNVEIDNVVVVAESSYTPTGSTSMAGTFYIQDAKPAAAGNGIGVYVAAADALTVPSIGDVVTVKGNLSFFEGQLQISAYTDIGVPLTITPGTGGPGTVLGGAYSPAGSPATPTLGPTFDGTAGASWDGGHPELIGQAITFSNSFTISNDKAPGLVHTKADGGTTSEGFEITSGSNNIYVYDSNVYSTCIEGKSADGGPVYPTLKSGITGVWDRYQDYGSDAGAVYSVLIPQSCIDIGVQ